MGEISVIINRSVKIIKKNSKEDINIKNLIVE